MRALLTTHFGAGFRRVLMLLLAVSVCLSLCACSQMESGEETNETVVFTDSADRAVEVPAYITRVAPSGAVAQMILATIAPDLLVGIANEPDSVQTKYYPEYMLKLPVFGQFYGSKATLNMESLLAANAQIVIDLGDKKDTVKEDMDMVQAQTGIPTVFIQSDMANLAAAYRTLGTLLGRTEKAEELAQFVEKTIAMTQNNAPLIAEAGALSVMYTSGTDGLGTNAKGSTQAQVLDIIGVENAIEVGEVSHKGGGNIVSLEQVYIADPDVIIVTTGGGYKTIMTDGAWADLSAVKNGRVYEIPGEPYCWMSGPPSVNMVIGIWWLGNLLFPDIYDYDMVQITKEFYSLFFDYDLSAQEAELLLANSTLAAH